MTRQSTQRQEATQALPCEICGKKDKCSRGSDGYFMCRGRLGKKEGWFFCGPCKKNPDFHGYRRLDDPLLYQNGGAEGMPTEQKGRKKENGEKPRETPLILKSQTFAAALTHENRVKLAASLGTMPSSEL